MLKTDKVVLNNIYLSIVTTGILFITFYLFTPFIYQTNDDMFISALISGVESGQPENRLLFINYLLGLILSFLHRIINSIPWYGIFLCSCHFLCMTLILFRCLCKTINNKYKMMVLATWTIFCFFIWMPQLASIQFTVTAAVLSGSAIFWYGTSEVEQSIWNKNTFITSFLIATSFCVRWEVALMSIPFAVAIWYMNWMKIKKFENKKICTQHFIMPIAIGLIFIALYSFDTIAYQSDEWKEFKTFNASRAKIFDYALLPEYEIAKETCEKFNITKESYDAVRERYSLILDENITPEAMENLAAISKQASTTPKSIEEKFVYPFKELIKRMLFYDSPYSIIVYIMYLYLILILFTNKNELRNRLKIVGFLGGMRTIIWMYIFYRGRVPDRIPISLYIIEMACLLTIFINLKLYLDLKTIKINYTKTLFLVTILISFILGIQNVSVTKKTVQERINLSTSYDELQQYCNNNLDNFYYFDLQILNDGEITREVLMTYCESNINYVFTGGWFAYSPWYERKYEKYDITNKVESLYKKNVFLIFKIADVNSKDYILNYLLVRDPKCKMQTVDIIETKYGFKYEVVKIVSE